MSELAQMGSTLVTLLTIIAILPVTIGMGGFLFLYQLIKNQKKMIIQQEEMIRLLVKQGLVQKEK